MLQQRTYQAKSSGPHAFETSGPNAPKWYIVDAKDMVVGRLATVLARVITGKHKPTFSRHVDTGDFVVVTNAEKVVFTRNKLDQKVYTKHTQYVGGIKQITARDLLQKKPEDVLWKAVHGMIPRNKLTRRQLTKLKIYKGDQHPHEAQKPQALPAHVMRKTILEKKKA